MSRSSTGKKTRENGEEWIGFWSRAICYFADEDGMSRRSVLCWGRRDERIVAWSIEREGGERAGLVRLFQDGVARYGSPRRALVPDHETSALLRAALVDSRSRIDVGGSPTLRRVFERQLDELVEGAPGAIVDDYLGGGRCALPVVRAFFQQVGRLWKHERVASYESGPLVVSCDEIAVHQRVVVFDNDSDEALVAFTVFESVRDFRAQRYDESTDDGSSARGATHLAIDSSIASDLRDELVHELESIGHGFGHGAYVPWLSVNDSVEVARPKTDDDYRKAAVIAAALAELFDERGDDWERLEENLGEREHVVRPVVDGSTYTVRFVFESPLLDPPLSIHEQWRCDFEDAVDTSVSDVELRSLEALVSNIENYCDGGAHPGLPQWVPFHVREFLMEHLVRRVIIEEDEVATAAPMFARFLRWLADTGRMPEAAALAVEASRLAPACETALRDPSRWGTAKQTMTMLRARGIDPRDTNGVVRIFDELGPPSKPLGLSSEGARTPAPLVPSRREEPKVGRNDACPCGSGRKYKKCHGA